MTKQEKLIRAWTDSELEKEIKTKRSITGGLKDYLKSLYVRYPKQFERVDELDLITVQEKEEAMA